MSQLSTLPASWENPVKARLRAGQQVIGLTITTSSVEAAARAASLGFDFLWLEMEHSAISLETVRNIVLATRGMKALPFARVPVNELWTAKRVLDSGVLGVIFPFSSTPELVRQAAAACKYPPHGRRGSGAGFASFCWPSEESYYDFADRNVLVVSIVEEASAVENIEEIAATPGIDVIFIGVSDLSFSLGLRGRQNEPLLDEAIAKIVAAAQRNGKWLGRPAGSADEVRRFHQQGFQFFQSVTELGLMKLGAKALLEPLGIKDKPREQSTFY